MHHGKRWGHFSVVKTDRTQLRGDADTALLFLCHCLSRWRLLQNGALVVHTTLLYHHPVYVSKCGRKALTRAGSVGEAGL